jgi:hypothetical protein
MLLDGIRDIQLISASADRTGNSVGSMMLIFQFPAGSFGTPVSSIHLDEVLELENRRWSSSDIRNILLPGLSIPHLAPAHLVDLV